MMDKLMTDEAETKIEKYVVLSMIAETITGEVFF